MATQVIETEVQDPLMEYLEDPFLHHLFTQVRKAGAIKGISVDLTHLCNLRCEGCCFFTDDLDQNAAPKDDAEFEALIGSWQLLVILVGEGRRQRAEGRRKKERNK